MKIDFDEIFKRLEGKANAIYINEESLMDLLSQVGERLQENQQLNKFWDDITLLMDLLRDWSRGDYENVSKNTIIMVIGGLLYLVNPFDIFPNILPGRFTGDLVVIAFIIKITSDELKKYKEWRGIRSEEETLNEDIIAIVDGLDEEEDSNIIIIGGGDE